MAQASFTGSCNLFGNKVKKTSYWEIRSVGHRKPLFLWKAIRLSKTTSRCPSFGGSQVSSPRFLIDRSYLRRSVISNQSRHFKETLENDTDAKNLQNKKIFPEIMQHQFFLVTSLPEQIHGRASTSTRLFDRESSNVITRVINYYSSTHRH